MLFQKPELSTLDGERDVEHKFLYPLLIGEPPSGLDHDVSSVKPQKNLRKFTIGKGSDQKSYFPDYLIAKGNIPLLVAEGKKPGADIVSAFREARLYAAELNAIYPSGLNPVTKILACNGTRLVAGLWDQATPLIDLSYDEIDQYSVGMNKLVDLLGRAALERQYNTLVPSIRSRHFWKPTKLVGGLAKQKEQVPINTFGATITTDFSHLFNPRTRTDRAYIAKHAYISSKRRERYIEPIDRVIRASTPPSISQSKTIEDTEKPTEIIKPFRDGRILEHKIMLLIGSAGAGKSTFVDYLQEQALPAEIRKSTVWLRIDMNPAPISREEIYNWLRDEIARGCKESSPETDFSTLESIKLVHAVEINSFRKGLGRLFEKDRTIYDQKLGDHLTQVMADKHKVAINFARYVSTQKSKLLIIVLDNSDKRLREEQLLMFEAAEWLQKEFRGLVILPLREETYDNHRNEPPLDTAIKDLVFRIEPPLFQKILVKRVELALHDLVSKPGQKILNYDLPNGMTIKYPASEQAYYLTSILRSIFEYDLLIRRLIVGLSGRNMRRALEIFLEFCTSGHIGTDEITKIRLKQGDHILPLSLVMNVLLRLSQRFYESNASYIKNLYSIEVSDTRPNFFSRLLILRRLEEKYNNPGMDAIKGYIRVETLRLEISSYGVEESIFRRELEYLAKAYCIVSENFSVSNISDEDLVSLAPAGFVHLSILSDQYYLAAIAEEHWFDNQETAQRVATRISDSKVHYEDSTVLENCEELLDDLEKIQKREETAYRAMFDDNSFDRYTNLSQARSRLRRFEGQLTSSAWVGAHKRYPVGSKHEGFVRNTTNYGVFIELESELAGLVHVSHLEANYRTDEKFERDKKVEVVVISIDRVSRKLDLRLA